VRLYSHYDDGVRNTACRPTAPATSCWPTRDRAPDRHPDEHWTYAIRSAAAAMVALKWLGPARRWGLVGVGTRGELPALPAPLPFDEIICTSRRPETRGRSANGEDARHPRRRSSVRRWCAAPSAIGCTIRTDRRREPWVRRGDLCRWRAANGSAGWARFDKTVIDDWDCNMTVREFRDMIEPRVRSRGCMRTSASGRGPRPDAVTTAHPGPHHRHGVTDIGIA
jgi:hypothetical protein